MAKIIKMRDELVEKRENLEKEISKQYKWIKIGNAIVIVLVFISLLCWWSTVFASTNDYNETKAKIEQAQENMKQQQADFQKEYNETKSKVEQGQAEVKKRQEEFQKEYNKTKAKVEQGQAEMNQEQLENQNQSQSETNKSTAQQIQDNKKEIQDKQAEFQKENKKSTIREQGFRGFFKAVFLLMIFGIISKLNRRYRLSKIKTLKTEIDKYNSGIKGEFNTIQSLARLSDDYTIIKNPRIATNGSDNELDNLIIGSNGIFIIEAKNHSGMIYGDVNDKNWQQERIIKNKPTIKEFYSPIMQVKQHSRRMEEFLRLRNYKLKTKPMVYFSNPDATLSINGNSETQVFCEKDLNKMLSTIENFKSDIILSETDKEKIINEVVSSMKK